MITDGSERRIDALLSLRLDPIAYELDDVNSMWAEEYTENDVAHRLKVNDVRGKNDDIELNDMMLFMSKWVVSVQSRLWLRCVIQYECSDRLEWNILFLWESVDRIDANRYTMKNNAIYLVSGSSC